MRHTGEWSVCMSAHTHTHTPAEQLSSLGREHLQYVSVVIQIVPLRREISGLQLSLAKC